MNEKNDRFAELNKRLQEHQAANTGNISFEKNNSDGESQGGPRSESSKMTLANQNSKPSSRKTFNAGHSRSASGHFHKPLAPKPPQPPKPPAKPLAPLKLLQPLVPPKPKL